MDDVLDISKAPVMFSHSSVYQLCNHTRNVKDHILDKLVWIEREILSIYKQTIDLNLFTCKEKKQRCYNDQFLQWFSDMWRQCFLGQRNW